MDAREVQDLARGAVGRSERMLLGGRVGLPLQPSARGSGSWVQWVALLAAMLSLFSLFASAGGMSWAHDQVERLVHDLSAPHRVGREPVASPSPALLAHVDAALRPGCKSAPTPAPGESAAIRCRSATGADLTLRRFDSLEQLSRYWDGSPANPDPSVPSRQLTVSTTLWPVAGGGEMRGTMAEYVNASRAYLLWTDDRTRILFMAVRADGDSELLRTWWSDGEPVDLVS